jgi:hypothetical protein
MYPWNAIITITTATMNKVAMTVKAILACLVWKLLIPAARLLKASDAGRNKTCFFGRFSIFYF